MKNTKRNSRAGSALIMVLVVVTGLLVMLAAVGRVALSHKTEVVRDVDDRRAFYLAEAGLTEAIVSMRRGASGSVGTATTPALLGGGVFWAEASDIGGGRTQIDVAALHGSGRSALQAVVESDGQTPLFEAVLSSRNQLTLNAGVQIDSFDSAVGTYASQAVNPVNGQTIANTNGDVSSNADIVLNANAMVFGDATPGPGHSVSLAATGSYVHGSTTPAQAPLTFPPIQVPNVPSAGGYSVPNNGTATLPSGTHGFSTLDIGKDGRLIVQGPADIVVDHFVGGKDAFLEIDATNGPVTFFVNQSYTHTNGFEAVPSTNSEMAVAFLISGTQPILFPSGSQVRGAYYAPDADITFTSSNEAWGSFVGNTVSMSSGTHFHFDETLMRHWNVDDGSNADTMNILVWRTRDFWRTDLLSDRRDPFAAMGLVRANLQPPSASWIF